METFKTLLILALFFTFFFKHPDTYTVKGGLIWFGFLVLAMNLP